MEHKKIWMCWFQGLDHASLPLLNRKCIEKWIELNPDWQINILDNSNINNFVPEYFDIVNNKNLSVANKSDILRIILLKKYGGVWVDASVYPIIPLSSFIDSILNDTKFFSYRFIPRSISNRNGDRETVSWFLVADEIDHYLISKWYDRYIFRFKKRRPRPRYFQFHNDLCYLYDTDTKIKSIIDNMVQIDQRIPHSAFKNWHRKQPSYLYKRPRLPRKFYE
jgi:hypothetical protein